MCYNIEKLINKQRKLGKKEVINMYIVATTAIKKDGTIRKGAKRHLTDICNTLEEARKYAGFRNKNLYKVEIYTGNWKLIEEIK